MENEDDMISAVFAPIERKLVCGQRGAELNESKTDKKSVKDSEDDEVTWTSLSDVCSAFLKAADAAGRDPQKELASLPIFNRDHILSPLAGGGSRLVVEPNKTLSKKAEKKSSAITQKEEVNKVTRSDSMIKQIVVDKSKGDIVLPMEHCKAKGQEADSCNKPIISIHLLSETQKVDTNSQVEELKNNNNINTPIRKVKDLKVVTTSKTQMIAGTKAIPLSRNQVNLLRTRPLIKQIDTTSAPRKRKLSDTKAVPKKKRLKFSRFARSKIRGFCSTPVNSPSKSKAVILTPLKVRKQKITVPRHLRPFLTSLQLGCRGIKQLVRCREKLDLLKDTEWEKRLVCLEYISNIVAVEDVTELEMVEEMRQLKRSLKRNVEDLRSKIVKCVADTIMIVADFLGNRFLPFFSYLFPALLKGLYVTVRIIRESHDRCISECVKAITEPRILKTLLDKRYVRDQHREVRIKTGALLVDFLNRDLLCTASSPIELKETKFAPYRRHTKDLLKTVTTLVSDQNSSVRETAKELLEAARICLVEKDVSKWLSALSSETKKRLLN